MSWQLSSEMIELCSCKLFCPCFAGPEGEPDRGWCSGALIFSIKQGTIDEVDVSGCRVALSADWPGNFLAGNGTARLYIDESANAAQRRELEAVFSGRKGGLTEGLFGAVISQWLPAKFVPIDISRGDSITIAVGDIGKATLRRIAGLTGNPVSVQGMAAQAAFASASMDLASSKGTRWHDPEMRSWEGDSGSIHERLNWLS